MLDRGKEPAVERPPAAAARLCSPFKPVIS
jgi:hypothetical protein